MANMEQFTDKRRKIEKSIERKTGLKTAIHMQEVPRIGMEVQADAIPSIT